MGDFVRIWEEIARIAARQYGHVTRAQLLALGLSERAVTYRIASAQLLPVHAGVYAVRYRRVEPLARAAAAVLACGPGAALSHDSAAALWGVRQRWPQLPEVTTHEHVRRPGIRAHRSRTLRTADVRIELGIRTVSAARAIRDIAPRLTDRQLVRAIQDGRRAGHIKPTALERLLATCPRAQRLVDPGQRPTRSGLEDLLVPWCARHGLPIPAINTYVNGYEVDGYYAEQRLIVELDSWEYHASRDSFASDRERDAHHLSFGVVTVRILPERLTAFEAQRLHRTLARRELSG